MNTEILELITEHKNITLFIGRAEYQLANIKEVMNVADTTEYANLAIQCKGMKIYREALEARLANRGIFYDEGEYYENVTDTNLIKLDVAETDYDNIKVEVKK